MISIMSFCSLLRVPFIIIIDQLFYNNFVFPYLPDVIFPVNSTLSQIEISESEQYNKVLFEIMVSCIMFCLSLSLLFLNVKYLFILYLQGVSVYVLLYSYWANIQTLEALSGKYENFKGDTVNEVMTWNVDGIIHFFTQSQLYQLSCSIILQYFLSLVFEFINVFTTDHSIHNIFKYSFFIPTLIASILKTSNILNTVTMLSTLLQLFILIKTFWFIILMMKEIIRDGYYYAKEIINDLGIYIFIEREWSRLKMSSVLRLFWVTRVLIHIYMQYLEIKNETLFGAIKYLLIKESDTWIAVLGMTSCLSYFCDNIVKFFQWVLLTNELDNTDGAIISAISFFTLAIQTDITKLDPENRWLKLQENIILLSAVLEHFIYNMVDKLFLLINASYNNSFKRHLRPLLVSGFLLVVAVTVLIYLWTNHSVSPWLLTVSFLNIKTIVKILASLAVYSLLTIDTCYNVAGEKLDDYVYYISSFGSTVKFGLCILLLLNGIYNVIFVSGGIIRAIIIIIQTFANIHKAKVTWEKYTRRNQITKKIESLSQATSTQLSEFNDVCAICYENMRSARITKCNHYFHGECLRKWFCENDVCPMCQRVTVS